MLPIKYQPRGWAAVTRNGAFGRPAWTKSSTRERPGRPNWSLLVIFCRPEIALLETLAPIFAARRSFSPGPL